jgi:hypothetical protein
MVSFSLSVAVGHADSSATDRKQPMQTPSSPTQQMPTQGLATGRPVLAPGSGMNAAG